MELVKNKKNALVVRDNGKDLSLQMPERVAELSERFENISKIEDVVEKIVALDEYNKQLSTLSSDICEASNKEKENKAEKSISRSVTVIAVAVWGAMMFGAMTGGLPGFIFATLMGGIGATGAIMMAALVVSGTMDADKANFKLNSGDLAFATQMQETTSKLLTEIVNTADTRQIALSEKAESIFDAHPRLRERFTVAQGIDKVRGEKVALERAPSLVSGKISL